MGARSCPHTWVLSQRSFLQVQTQLRCQEGGQGQSWTPASVSPPNPCGQSNAPGRGGLGQESHLLEVGVSWPDRGPFMKGQRWALREGSEMGPP